MGREKSIVAPKLKISSQAVIFLANEFSCEMKYFGGTVAANKFLFAGTVPANNLFLLGKVAEGFA